MACKEDSRTWRRPGRSSGSRTAPATSTTARAPTGPLRGREKPLGLKTELELRFANRLVLLCHKAGRPSVPHQGQRGRRAASRRAWANPQRADRAGIVALRTHRRLRVGESLWVGERRARRQQVLGGKPSALGREEGIGRDA